MKIAIKNFTMTLLSIVVIILMVFIQSCKTDDPTISEVDRVSTLLKGNSWKMQSVSVGGIDKTSSFAGLTLTFSTGTYTSTNGGLIWPSSGTWTFADETGKIITRNDGVVINLEEISETKLSLKLNWAKTTLGGRTTSVAGNHIFVFGK